MSRRPPLEVRFWQKVDKRGPDECWEWKAAKDGLGYGWIGDGHKHMARANRVSYILNIGPIPVTNPRTIVLHRCDNPSCVNPAHLFLGTDRTNNDDKETKRRGKHPYGVACHSAKFTPELVKIVRSQLEAGETPRLLARKYGVTEAAIRKIKNRKSWAHVI